MTRICYGDIQLWSSIHDSICVTDNGWQAGTQKSSSDKAGEGYPLLVYTKPSMGAVKIMYQLIQHKCTLHKFHHIYHRFFFQFKCIRKHEYPTSCRIYTTVSGFITEVLQIHKASQQLLLRDPIYPSFPRTVPVL